MPPAVSGDQDWSYTEGRKVKQNEKISVSQALRDMYMKAVPVPSSSSNLLSSRNQVLESKSLLCYNCFRFQSFMDFLCKDSTTVLHTTVEVVLTFTNVTLNFTTPLNESSAMSYGTLLYTKRRAKRATVAAKKAKQQLFDSHFLCILILMKI